jgi:hypothetical protein
MKAWLVLDLLVFQRLLFALEGREGWKDGRMEEWNGRMEGREGWRVRRLDDRKDGRMEGMDKRTRVCLNVQS